MAKTTKSTILFTWAFTVIRILIGWHFLYEGLAKMINPNWSAAPMLLESTWVFPGFFKSLALNSDLITVVNFMNTWGLILIGLGLFLGLFTRISSISGTLLLFLYYIVQPPFTGFIIQANAGGSYLWVNSLLIEIAILIMIFMLPKSWFFSIDNFWAEFGGNTKVRKMFGSIEVPKEDNPEFSELPVFDRRRVLKNLISIPVFGVFSYAVLKNFGYESYEE